LQSIGLIAQGYRQAWALSRAEDTVMKARCLLLLISLSFAVLFATQASASPEPAHASPRIYTFGVVPQFEQRKLYATWKPVVDELSKQTGLKFNLVTTLKIQDFEKAFFRGEFDFVYVNPYHVVLAHNVQGYIPLVADTKPVRGILVVRSDSLIRRPEELDGKSVALPSPNALGSSLLVRSDLDQIYHVHITPLYVATHSSVYLHVAKNLATAGGGVEKTLQEQDPGVRALLRVIYTTRSCASHPVTAHPRVPEADRRKVAHALLAMNTSPEGRAMMANIPATQWISVDYTSYQPMERWGLEKYWAPIDKDK
jgi:phosphonate transport system substrate-binding protein